jgi:hypothetical protein
MAKAMNIRFTDEVTELLDARQGELRDLSINTLVNVAVRRFLAGTPISAASADDAEVERALKRVLSRDASILEALKNL